MRRGHACGHRAALAAAAKWCFGPTVLAINRVSVVARVTAFLEKRNFVEGSEVKSGDLLYQLERGPFEAELNSKQAEVAQLKATLVNAKLTRRNTTGDTRANYRIGR
jgi:multidrug efflux pump subunit AcrA (membrane-fusion protein)